MSPFSFRSFQLLELSDDDSPSIDVQDNQLILTAERDGEQIRITAPLTKVLPQVSARSVKMPGSSRRGKPLAGGEKRQGELNGMAKLTDEHVREIRLMLSDLKFTGSYHSRHALYEELARAYNVHMSTIRSIACNESWKHIKV